MIIFLWISTITLLNFLIAILTHVYDYKSKIEVGLYLQNIINIKKVLESDSKYWGLVSMVPPLNFFTFLFTPFIMWFGSKRLNTILLHASYIPIMISGTFIFLISSVILSPFAYFALLFKLIKDILSPVHTYKSRTARLADIFIFFFAGIFILLGQVISDTVFFVLDLYNDNLWLKYKTKFDTHIRDNKYAIDPLFYQLFISFLRNQKKDSVRTKKLIKKLSKVLKIDQQIHNLLYLTEPEKLREK